MSRMWEPSTETTRVELLGECIFRNDGSGRLQIRVAGQVCGWELHSHIVTQLLRIRQDFHSFDLDVRIVENYKVSSEEPIPYVQISPVLKPGV